VETAGCVETGTSQNRLSSAPALEGEHCFDGASRRNILVLNRLLAGWPMTVYRRRDIFCAINGARQKDKAVSVRVSLHSAKQTDE